MPAQGDALCPQPTPAGAQRLLDDQIEPFLQHLRDAGYAERTLRKKRTVARAFARWAKRKGIATIDLNDGHVAAFVARLPRKGKSRREVRTCSGATVLGLFTRDCRSAVPTSRKRPSRPRPAFFNSTRITCARIAGSRRIRSAFICRWSGPFSRPNSRTVVSRNH